MFLIRRKLYFNKLVVLYAHREAKMSFNNESEWIIMSNFDSVEKLRERANVSYEDAKNALEAGGGDLLEALIYLEKQGKVSSPAAGSYSSRAQEPQNNGVKQLPPKTQKGESFGKLLERFFRWVGSIIRKGNTNYFEGWRYDQRVLSIPVTVLVLLLLCAFWIVLPLLVIGLFMNFRYVFKGPSVESIDMNSVMDSAAKAADSLKNEVKTARQNGCAHEQHKDNQ